MPDPFYVDDNASYANSDAHSSTSHTDSSIIGPIGSQRLVDEGAYVIAHIADANINRWRRITGAPDANTVSHNDLGAADGVWSLTNSLHGNVLDRSGEFYIDTFNSHRIYLWPVDAQQPSAGEVTMTVRARGIELQDTASHVTVEGFRVEKFNDFGIGRDGTGTISGIVIRNNEVNRMRESGWSQNAIEFHHVNGILIENNGLFENSEMRGIMVDDADDVTVSNNTLNRIGATGINLNEGVHNAKILRNELRSIRGIHTNGISVYGSALLVARNRVIDSFRPRTIDGASDVYVVANVFDAGGNIPIAIWSEGVDNLHLYNNLLLGASDNAASWTKDLSLFISCSANGITARNNVMEDLFFRPHAVAGSCGYGDFQATFINNVYFDVSDSFFSQTGAVVSDIDLAFVNRGGEDFRPSQNSVLIDGGVDISA